MVLTVKSRALVFKREGSISESKFGLYLVLKFLRLKIGVRAQ